MTELSLTQRMLLAHIEAAPAAPESYAADAEQIARAFHETYERLAPDYGYRTRESSAVQWEQVPVTNRALMIATCREVLTTLDDRQHRSSPACWCNPKPVGTGAWEHQ